MDDVDRAQALSEVWLSARLRLARAVRGAGNGMCRTCGEPISAARLTVMPNAARCVDCQRDAEAGAS